jgi:hypothetical protein
VANLSREGKKKTKIKKIDKNENQIKARCQLQAFAYDQATLEILRNMKRIPINPYLRFNIREKKVIGFVLVTTLLPSN